VVSNVDGYLLQPDNSLIKKIKRNYSLFIDLLFLDFVNVIFGYYLLYVVILISINFVSPFAFYCISYRKINYLYVIVHCKNCGGFLFF